VAPSGRRSAAAPRARRFRGRGWCSARARNSDDGLRRGAFLEHASRGELLARTDACDVGNVVDASGLQIAAKLRQACRVFGSRVSGFLTEEAVLSAVESRTSAPVRVVRDPVTWESRTSGGSTRAAKAQGMRVDRQRSTRRDGGRRALEGCARLAAVVSSASQPVQTNLEQRPMRPDPLLSGLKVVALDLHMDCARERPDEGAGRSEYVQDRPRGPGSPGNPGMD